VEVTPLLQLPLLQLGFWLGELEVGAQLVQLRASGAPLQNPTSLRLQLQSGGGCERWCVKNTFLDSSPGGTLGPRRSNSQPPRPSLSGMGDGHQDCRCAALGLGAHSSAAGQPQPKLSRSVHAVARQSRPCLPAPEREGPTGPLALSPTASDGAVPWDAAHGLQHKGAPNIRGPPFGVSARMSSRWWSDVSEVCPLSGFPVKLLPYPPFKFQVNSDSPRDSCRLVDGSYLVLQVLAGMCFEALGRRLTLADVQALDEYMRRCRLGPFRLGWALELLRCGTPSAEVQLGVLCRRARRKLEALRHIKRIRLARRY